MKKAILLFLILFLCTSCSKSETREVDCYLNQETGLISSIFIFKDNKTVIEIAASQTGDYLKTGRVKFKRISDTEYHILGDSVEKVKFSGEKVTFESNPDQNCVLRP